MHSFFEQNDCDQLLRWPRLIITLLGVCMGVICFCGCGNCYVVLAGDSGAGTLCLWNRTSSAMRGRHAGSGAGLFFSGRLVFVPNLAVFDPGQCAGLVSFAIAQVSKFCRDAARADPAAAVGDPHRGSHLAISLERSRGTVDRRSKIAAPPA